MTILIIVINSLISMAGLALAWQAVSWRRSLAALSHTLESTERDLARDLPQAKEALLAGAEASKQAAQQLGQLKQRWQQVQQILTLLSLWQAASRRTGHRAGRRTSHRTERRKARQ